MGALYRELEGDWSGYKSAKCFRMYFYRSHRSLFLFSLLSLLSCCFPLSCLVLSFLCFFYPSRRPLLMLLLPHTLSYFSNRVYTTTFSLACSNQHVYFGKAWGALVILMSVSCGLGDIHIDSQSSMSRRLRKWEWRQWMRADQSRRRRKK